MNTRPGTNFKSLPFDENPPYKAYLDTAYALGIVNAQFDMRYELCLSYVNLAATPPALMKTGACPLYILPWNTVDRFAWLGYVSQKEQKLDLARISHQFIADWIIEVISADNYVYLTVNEKHLPGTWPHAKGVSFTHPCLVTGFDENSECFRAYAYRSDGSFGLISPSFSNLAAALTDRGNKSEMVDSYFYEPKIFTIQKNSSFLPKPFNKYNICKVLYEYIDCRAPDRLIGAGEYFGSAAVSHFLTELAKSVSSSQSIDLRGTRVLMEQRGIVASNIEYIATQVEIPNIVALRKSYQEVLKWAQSLHLLCYHNMTQIEDLNQKKDQLLSRHLSILDRIQNLDVQVMTSIARALESTP